LLSARKKLFIPLSSSRDSINVKNFDFASICTCMSRNEEARNRHMAVFTRFFGEREQRDQEMAGTCLFLGKEDEEDHPRLRQ
jgi:hypothetical protein